jgi:uncharacterized protein YaiI (UPF0178 family)
MRFMTTLFIDADACPVTREALSIAKAHKVEAVLVANATQNLNRYVGRAGVDCIEVSGGRDAADFAIVERLQPGDVVVTQDLGLAAMALGRGASSMSPRGRVHSAATIDAELAVRHAEQKHRRSGGRTQGPPALKDEDRERFRTALQRVLSGSSGR